MFIQSNVVRFCKHGFWGPIPPLGEDLLCKSRFFNRNPLWGITNVLSLVSFTFPLTGNSLGVADGERE